MAESQCLSIKIKPGETEKFVSWAKSLGDRKDEVRKALQAEGIIAEHIFLDRTSVGDSIIFYTKAIDLKKASEAFQKSELSLDLEAKRIMAETWDFSSAKILEPLVDL